MTLQSNPVGRPSEYKPDFCNAVIDFMSKGYSLTAFAGSIRMARDTVYDWCKKYPDFSDAVNQARATRITKLESGLFEAEGSQVTAHIFALKNACPAEWKDVQHVENNNRIEVSVSCDQMFKQMIESGEIDASGKILKQIN